MNRDENFVFVYGTLLRGEANHRRLRGARLRAAKASVAGQLYDTGRGYPAMTTETTSPEAYAAAVLGEVYEVDTATLRSLDELEDFYGPDDLRNEYERVRIEVETEDGKLMAWTYVYKQAPTSGKRISGGDWRGFPGT